MKRNATFTWRNIGWAGTGRVVALGTTFLLSIVAARGLGAAESGRFFAALSLASALTLLAGLGVDQSVVFLLGAARGGTGVALASVLRKTEVVAFLGVTAIGLVLALPPLRPVWEVFLGDGDVRPLVWAVLVLVAGRALARYYAESARGLGNIAEASVVGDLIGPVGGLVALVAVAVIAHPATDSSTYVLVVGGAWLLAALVGRSRRRTGYERSTRAATITFRRIATVSGPALVLGAGSSIIQQGDVLVASAVMSPEALAIYALASRMAVVVAVPLGIAAAAMAPDIAYLYQRGELAELSTVLRRSTFLASGSAAVIVLALVALGPWGLRFLAGEPFSGSWLPLVIVGLGHLGAAATGLCGVTLLMSGNERAVMVVALVGAALIVLATWLGARSDSPTWIAVAVSAAMIATNVINHRVARSRTGIDTSLLGRPVRARA